MENTSKTAGDDYIYIRLPKEMKKKIKKVATEDYCSVTVWVRQTLAKALGEK